LDGAEQSFCVKNERRKKFRLVFLSERAEFWEKLYFRKRQDILKFFSEYDKIKALNKMGGLSFPIRRKNRR